MRITIEKDPGEAGLSIARVVAAQVSACVSGAHVDIVSPSAPRRKRKAA